MTISAPTSISTSMKICVITPSIFLAALSLCALWYFPIAQISLLIAIILYVGLLFYKPLSWIIILPLITVGLSLSPWSGRFIFNEHDMFMLITVAVGLLNTLRSPNLGQTYNMLVPYIFTAFCLISITHVPLATLFGPTTQNFYFSEAYPFSVTKGIAYGSSLCWLLIKHCQQDRKLVVSYLVFAAVLTSILLFIIALWERKTFGALLDHTPWMKVAHSFLNFSGAYRMTGVMADMHTGGESLDGIFLLLAPINLLGVYVFKSHKAKVFALVGLLSILYCVLVGFTRATYVATAVGLLAFATMHFAWELKAKKNQMSSFPIFKLCTYGVYIISVWFAYAQTGYYVIGAAALGLILTMLVNQYRAKVKQAYWPIILMINILIIYICIDSFYDSKWVEKTNDNMFLLFVALSGIIITIFIANSPSLQKGNTPFYHHLAIIIISAILTVAIGGTRIQMRMDTTSRDLDTRVAHWNTVIDSSQWSFKDMVMGNGLGSFPLNYVTNQPDLVRRIGSYTLTTNGKENTLLLGPGEDLAFGQRLDLKPNTQYRLNIELEPHSITTKTELVASLCERNLIIFEYWAVNCEAQRIKIPSSEDTLSISTIINSKTVGSNIGIKRLPTVMLLRYKKGPAPLAIKSIELLDDSLESTVTNSHFSKGTDHWFFYHDFEHLPWHIKNIYLSVFYQLGAIGSLLFVIMLGIATKKVIASPIESQPLNGAIASIILAYLAFGLFGDPLDSSRVSSLFFMLLFFLVSNKSVKT
ncbi:hypothetical protein [Paraglaciecola marina]|uniref:hypothetical protein n=1 Tax=Paraglaciecola marina TaxID=2500157 RepID=UPI00105F14BD|nr:hypothetical protein [Paraglaciecola marina]